MAQSRNHIKQFSNFTRTSAGLEKTFRLLQATAQIATQITVDNVAGARFGAAKAQLALTRRFLRFFNFIDCFDRAIGLLGGGSSDTFFLVVIELVRWSCLGLYFLMEDFTILHATNIYPVSWNRMVLVEAYKFWFYAISLSIFSALWRLAFTTVVPVAATQPKEKADKKKVSPSAEQVAAVKAERVALVKRLVVDSCDLLIPGTFLGWLEASELTIGVTMVVSTLVSGRDIWVRAQ